MDQNSTPTIGELYPHLSKEKLVEAEHNHFHISTWLEEMETAAKQGRPVFSQALKLLRTGKAQGIILHKLDRGARNLKDWAAIGELSDQGIEVHFVNESLDLNSRGGRLSADIQAVVAADFIRNLRQETRKGFYGRLKQGLYPLRAPIGYLDQGKGKAKTIDPVMGPLVRRAFELYGSVRYNFETLGEELHRNGLRNKNGGRVSRNGLSTMLNNPFYIGIIRIRKSGENFAGSHDQLISRALFDRVHGVLTGKINSRTQRHSHLFRRMLSCAGCPYSLIGERQKGHVYYRCHSKQCSTSIREEKVSAGVVGFLESLKITEKEKAYFKARLLTMRETWATHQEDETRNLKVRLGQIKDRLNRLTDAFLDNDIDKIMFEERKKALLLDQKEVEANLAGLIRYGRTTPDKVEKFLELAANPVLSHELAFPDEKREMVNILTSNRQVHANTLTLTPSIAFVELANRSKTTCCEAQADRTTWNITRPGAYRRTTLFGGACIWHHQARNGIQKISTARERSCCELMDPGECGIQSKKVIAPPDTRLKRPHIWFSGAKHGCSAECHATTRLFRHCVDLRQHQYASNQESEAKSDSLDTL